MKPTVVNTRPREQAGQLTHLLAAAGFGVLEAPAIETVSAWAPGALAEVHVDLAANAYAWVVLPSQNAGRLLARQLGDGGARTVCGAASARALGIVPEFALDRFSAAAALEVLRPLVRPGERILVPRAADASAELRDGLEALGAHVHAPMAYRTVAVDPATLANAAQGLQNHEVQAVTACSPSAITSLLAAVGRESLSSAKLICLGQTTAEAARELTLKVDGVAQKTSMAALVEAVVAALARPVVSV